MQDNKAEQLFKKYQSGESSPEEQSIVENYIFFEGITTSTLTEEEMQIEMDDLKSRLGNIPNRKRKLWPLITVAASILVLLSVGLIFLLDNNKGSYQYYSLGNDITPGSNTATLTLSNGKKILINNSLNGAIGNDVDAGITKADNRIVYGNQENSSASIEYNTLSTANAQQYSVTLADGTIVWLNAASSLKYPVSFAKNGIRKVELTGEAYFEVAKDKNHPFVVQSKNNEVKVLGTHFNVSAYSDESSIKTTLLEGSVLINEKTKIIPGEQAVLKNGLLSVIVVNTQIETSWTKGEFMFRKEPLENIMLKISRWYNVEVVYKDLKVKSELFGGSISKFGNVSEVLQMLEMTGSVHFKIEGRRIIVMK